MSAGYADAGYVRSLGEFGAPLELPQCGGWTLRRRIPEATVDDAMGCYPLFCCRDWRELPGDIEREGKELVSLALVADPFGNHDESLLRRCFPDKLIAFKKHLIVDFSQPLAITAHHRYYARKALKSITVSMCERPAEITEEWCGLYDVLTRRHRISGIRAFSKRAFSAQLSLSGMTVFRAVSDGETVGAQLWIEGAGGVAYSHLAAFNEKGYQRRASYAIYHFALEHFRGKGLRFLDLGADAGTATSGKHGLGSFKRGWCNADRTVYFCGRIFDSVRYDELSARSGQIASLYFPAYRAGEF